MINGQEEPKTAILVPITNSYGDLDPDAVAGTINDVFYRLQVAEANQTVTTQILKAITENIDGPISDDLSKALKGGGNANPIVPAGVASLVTLLLDRRETAAPVPPPVVTSVADAHAAPWTVTQQVMDDTGLIVLNPSLRSGGFTTAMVGTTACDRFIRFSMTNASGNPFPAGPLNLCTVTYKAPWTIRPNLFARADIDVNQAADAPFVIPGQVFAHLGGELTNFILQGLLVNDWQDGATVIFAIDALDRPFN